MKVTNTALVMASNKDGIADFGRELAGLGVTIYGSRGTVACLKQTGIAAIDIATIVGPPILGHRVVSISREIAAATLARDVEEDIVELEKLGLPRFDIICVDFYPLEKEIAKPESTKVSVIEATDIGGPNSIRSGVKGGCLVVCRTEDRAKAILWLKAGRPENGFLEDQAARGEFEVGKYATASATYLSEGKYVGVFGERVTVCGYGENAYQTPAGLFSSGATDPLALDKFTLVEGKPLSYNNFCDLDRLLQTMTHAVAAMEVNNDLHAFPFIALAVKHGNCCGAAWASDPEEALKMMVTGDRDAIMGGVVMTNFEIHAADADILAHYALRDGEKRRILDAVFAPSFEDGAREELRRVKDNCRFGVNPALSQVTKESLDTAKRFRYVRGGLLMQPNYTFVPNLRDRNVITHHGEVSDQQIRDLAFGWAIGATSNSNTIALVKDQMLDGLGVAQQSRVGAGRLAVDRSRYSGRTPEGSVAYSDSFFPFDDAVLRLIEAGVKAIFTSKGGMRFADTLKACEDHGIPLLTVPDEIGRGFFGH